MKLYTLIIALFLFTMTLSGQDSLKYDVPFGTVIGINISPLIFSLAPFTNENIGTRYFGHTYKKWGSKYAFRFTLGMGIFIGDFNTVDDEGRLYLGLGWERPSRVYKRWRFHRGAEFAVFSGDLREDDSSFDETFGIGYIPFYEVQFKINDMIYLATSAKLVFGLSLDSATPILRILPPLDIMAYIKF